MLDCKQKDTPRRVPICERRYKMKDMKKKPYINHTDENVSLFKLICTIVGKQKHNDILNIMITVLPCKEGYLVGEVKQG